MAVIVQQQQPNWLAQLAAQTIVPMISNAIERQRERDNNRKYNISMAEALKRAGLGAGVQPQTSGLTSGMMNGGNGWQNALHHSDSPLAQFDASVADILPPSAQSIMTQPVAPANQPLSRSQLLESFINTLADPRFSYLSSEEGIKRFGAFLDANDVARQEFRQNEGADKIMNAGNAEDMFRTGLIEAARGNLPQWVMQNLQGYYQYENPHYITSNLNLGGQQQMISVNPRTGEVTTEPAFTNTLSPQQVKDNEYRDNMLTYTKESDEREFNEKVREFDTETDLQQQRINDARTNADRDYDLKRIQIMSDVDFKNWQMEQAQKTAQAGAWSKEKEEALKFHNAHLEQLNTDIKNLQEQYNNAQSEDEREGIKKQLYGEDGKGGLFAERKAIRDAIYSLFYPPQPTRYKSTGGLILGIDTPRIVKGGEYGASRDNGTREHHGVDYAMDGGSNITVHHEMGSDFKVIKVNTDPNASGYGCYIEIEGTRNGKKVRYRMGHMQEGSINVKEGDEVKAGEVVGLVGNTGHSSGNHLHLEVREFDGSNWVLKNPEQYITDEPTQTKAQTTATEESKSNGQAQQGNGQAPQDNGQTVDPDEQVAIAQHIAPPPLMGAQNMPLNYQTVDTPTTHVATNQQGSGLTPIHTLEVAPTPQQNANLAPPPLTGSQDMQPITTQTAQQTPTPTTTTSWSNPFSATPAYADDLPIDAVSGASPDDGGLTQYRAEGDYSPVIWRNASGSPRLTSDRQLFTQKIYDEWATKADAGGFRDVGINNRVDLDKWLNSIGMSPYRPAEQRGLNNLNGRSNANLPPEGVDDGLMPFDSRPSTSPEKSPAPTFTDEINGTTPTDTQDLLDGLNGTTDNRVRNWTRALRQYYPSAAYTPEINVPERPNIPEAQPMPTGTPSSNRAAPTQARASSAAPTRTAPAPRRAEPAPRRGYTNYAEQRSAVDTAAKNNGIDSSLIRAIIEVESSWKPTARSKAGAMGLMQLMPATARERGMRNAYDPAQNIAGGSKYIARLIRRYGGDVSKALMAYNCGPGNVAKGRIPQASRQYAQKVMSIYNRLKAQG